MSQKGARRGEQVLHQLRERPSQIWYQGEEIRDVTTHPALRGGVQTLARLYDLQWEHSDVALYDSPLTGNKVGRSFLLPRTHDELRSVGRALRVWEDHTRGFMGRLPTYLNRGSMALAAAAAFFGDADARFGANVIRHHERMRENDLSMTSTFTTPQVNRGVSLVHQADPFIAAHVKHETDAGLVIRGCKTLATLPFADELLVYSAAPLRDPEKEARYAFMFAIPTSTPGLRFICRESVDYGRSGYDHPLGSRFEEMDAVVVFDDVLVPWDSVFAFRDMLRCNGGMHRSGAMAHMDHQVVVKNVVKTEFLLGLASLLVNTIGAEVFQHIYEKLSEIWLALETLKAFVKVAEADAALDEWGVMRPAEEPLVAASLMFSRAYPRVVEIIQQIGASGLVSMPTEAEVNGPLAEDIKKYYQAARAEAHERIPLFRLAWDAAMSAFASRQVLYERFNRGDPVRSANAVIVSQKATLEGYAERVAEFIRHSQTAASDETSGG